MFNWTPLHWAAQNGHLSVVDYLVNNKAEINSKSEKNWTPLHISAINGYIHVVKYLVNKKADINAKTENLEICKVIQHQFIMLLKKVILMLLTSL